MRAEDARTYLEATRVGDHNSGIVESYGCCSSDYLGDRLHEVADDTSSVYTADQYAALKHAVEYDTPFMDLQTCEVGLGGVGGIL